MRPLVAVCVIASGFFSCRCLTAQPARDPAELVRRIQEFRAVALSDSQAIDICDLRGFFGNGGKVLAGPGWKAVKYDTVERCRQRPSGSVDGVRLTDLRPVGTTIVVSGITRRGPVGLREEYVFTETSGTPSRTMTYSILSFSER